MNKPDARITEKMYEIDLPTFREKMNLDPKWNNLIKAAWHINRIFGMNLDKHYPNIAELCHALIPAIDDGFTIDAMISQIDQFMIPNSQHYDLVMKNNLSPIMLLRYNLERNRWLRSENSADGR